MGGMIGVESTVGVGSLFWVELALTTAPQLAAPEAGLVLPQAPVAAGAPLRTLLYVEDNPANLELVEQLIARRSDLRLLTAADGNLGIEFARAYLPDVILMDINLPGISGIEAMKILRADPQTAHIPIVALSANAVPRDIEKGLEAGFFNYLTKPIKVRPVHGGTGRSTETCPGQGPGSNHRRHHMTLTEEDILQARILVVDDQEANIALLSQLLQEAGYTQVSSTMNPQEVCALHRRDPYELILLDLQMPGMDGFQVMQGLKTSLVDRYMPVIVLTAQPGHKLRALQAGARDFISKPFDLVEVKTRIRNMLEVRLLYRKLDDYNKRLEQVVQERTAELRESEARYRSLTELASDWYWEQDEAGAFTRVSGPVLEMLGLQVNAFDDNTVPVGDVVVEGAGWNRAQREALQAMITARQPFLDFLFSRTRPDGSQQQYRVSGEPMFNQACRFLGYRGIGVEVMART
jgi:PAS domain S-box-containing protein